MKASVLSSTLITFLVSACAYSPAAVPDDQGPLLSAQTNAPSPCKNPTPDVLLCADFDDGNPSDVGTTAFGGGVVEPTTDNAVSMPSSLHVQTIVGTEAAAALVFNRAPFSAAHLVVDADLLISPEVGGAAVGDDKSSLLRVSVMDANASRGAFFLHYVKQTGELTLIGDDGNGTVLSHSLGVAPSGFFHVNILVAPGVGGGAYAEAQVDDGDPRTITIEGNTPGDVVYSLEAGLNVPAANAYDAYLDNLVVRAK